MLNKDIIRSLRKTVSLMEIHGANEFKIRAINNAMFTLERLNVKLAGLTVEELNEIKGIGKSIAAQITTIINKGESDEYLNLLQQTPAGVLELTSIPGLGAKKIRQLWLEENIDDPQKLLTAIHSGALKEIKGFGDKTITQIHNALLFLEENKNKLLLPEALEIARRIVNYIHDENPIITLIPTGGLRLNSQVVDELGFIMISEENPFQVLAPLNNLKQDESRSSPFIWRGNFSDFTIPVSIRKVARKKLPFTLLSTTGPATHLNDFDLNKHQHIQVESEKDIYVNAGKPYVPPVLREANIDPENIRVEEIIQLSDIKGILHAHSNYSDGQSSLRDMIAGCKERGLTYLGITDHSKSSFFYANGLFENRVQEQFAEIEQLQKEFPDFKIFKGIECDILNTGELDYHPDMLQQFDFIIASVHSVLNMDIAAATARLVKAIENPFTTILGHLTGRLLLRRSGYPLHMPTILDACKANDVCIEINANPRRLDIDWKFLSDLKEKEIKVSINPDAHTIEGFDDITYGVSMAQKGLITPKENLTSLSADSLTAFFETRKENIPV